ncbi:MAG: TolC family protein [Treponema sp.]|nr:TolC family protein [Treponema sp.]
MDLDKAVSLALENNLNLKKSDIDLAASGYSEKKIWAELFPSITANLTTGFANTPLFSGDGFELKDNNLRNSAGIGISLGLNAGLPYLMNNIRLAHQTNLLKYEDARKQLSIQITKRFYSLIAEKNNLLLLEEVLNLAQRQFERNEISFRNGLVRELAVIQSRLAVENARYNLSAASTAYANNMGEFLALLGADNGDQAILLGEINITKINAGADELIGRYLPERPDITSAKREIERLENAERQAFFQSRAPSLSLSMDWSMSKFNPFTDSFGASARLSIPIDPWIPGTSKEQSGRRAADSIEKAKLDLSITEDSAKTQIRSLCALLANSWDSIVIARLGLEAAEIGYQLTDQGFRSGTIESLVLEDARNNMANARYRLLQTELSYFNMILDLSAAINMDWKNLIETFGVPSEEK